MPSLLKRSKKFQSPVLFPGASFGLLKQLYALNGETIMLISVYQKSV